MDRGALGASGAIPSSPAFSNSSQSLPVSVSSTSLSTTATPPPSDHALSLKVMRLHRPHLSDVAVAPTCATDICAAVLDAVQSREVLPPPLAPSPPPARSPLPSPPPCA